MFLHLVSNFTQTSSSVMFYFTCSLLSLESRQDGTEAASWQHKARYIMHVHSTFNSDHA